MDAQETVTDIPVDLKLDAEDGPDDSWEDLTAPPDVILEPMVREDPVPVPPGEVWQIVGIRLPHSCMVYRVGARMQMLQANGNVVVQTSHGEENGVVVFASHQEEMPAQERLYPGPIKQIKRALDGEEYERRQWCQERELQARILCKESIRQLGLAMKLSKVTFMPDGTKAIFYFTAENRVDFRELVRILARHFQMRVEMRQIGVRDETRLLNGLGPCGRTFCCAGHLDKFYPVSVRMAKNQELSLNPDAISGVCGRLMCCLGYENELYRTLRGTLPKVNCRMRTQDGREVQIRNIHPIRGTAEVQFCDETGGRANLTIAELTYVNPEDRPAGDPDVAEESDAVVEELELPVMNPLPLSAPSGAAPAARRGEKASSGKRSVPRPEAKPEARAEVKVAEGEGEKRKRRRRVRRKKSPEKEQVTHKTAPGKSGKAPSGER
ncbi:MAG: hypothetical protein HQL63_04670 [Magnetococcales bacterium]|nr:hypothetical protein [Magnetococcales bacterium]